VPSQAELLAVVRLLADVVLRTHFDDVSDDIVEFRCRVDILEQLKSQYRSPATD
jgi:hypothetical protein